MSGVNTKGILLQVMGILGIVLVTAVFPTIMTAFNNLRYGGTSLTPYIAFDTILGIGLVLLWLGALVGSGIAAAKGYSFTAEHDTSGFVRMILGALAIILFVTMFATVLTNVETVRTTTNISNYTAMLTVVYITPAILFLGGLFTGGRNVVGGGRAAWKRFGNR